MKKRGFRGFLTILVVGLVLVAAGCGGGGNDTGGDATAPSGPVQALPSSLCSGLEYGGEGDAQVLIVSDLPLQGASRTQTSQMNHAIRLILGQNGWKAGDLNVAFQACDDSTAQAGTWDPGKCKDNAQAYASNPSVVGVIGTLDSGCATISIPILNEAPGGGVAIVSPANTYVCLTEGGPGCADTEPDQYYPAGTRNYARVVADDTLQAAAAAEFLQDKGVTELYILNDEETYGRGVAENLRGAAEALGIEVVGFEAWDRDASSYEALFQKVEQSGANGVFLGGLIDENGGQVIRDKVAVLGPNAATADEGVVLIASDGFTTQATVEIDEGGAGEADGMYLTVAGVPTDQLGPAGEEFVSAFEGAYADALAGKPLDPYTAYAAQSAQVILDAVARGGADRAAVIEAMFGYSVEDGVLGTFSFDENGDPTGAEGAVGAVTVYRANSKTALAEVANVISPA